MSISSFRGREQIRTRQQTVSADCCRRRTLWEEKLFQFVFDLLQIEIEQLINSDFAPALIYVANLFN
jgi:hypothetical protein